MSREKQIDYKEYARQMRQNCARDYNGTEPIVICSSELWEEIATIIDDFDKQSEVKKCALIHEYIREKILENCDYETKEAYEKAYNTELSKLADTIIIKNEVEKIFEEIERFLYIHFRFCKEEIGNDDTEYVKGRMELNAQIQNFIAELKKKYTEENK